MQFGKKLNKTQKLKKESQNIKDIIASKLKKITKTEVFGKSTYLLTLPAKLRRKKGCVDGFSP